MLAQFAVYVMIPVPPEATLTSYFNLYIFPVSGFTLSSPTALLVTFHASPKSPSLTTDGFVVNESPDGNPTKASA